MAVRYVVSACLAGERCRYDAGDNTCAQVVRLVEEGRAVPICPEVLGGLETPRSPCERLGDRVMNRDGPAVTLAFAQGAAKATALARKEGCSAAILKSRSPSCGFDRIYDGSFSHVFCKGDGVWAAMLRDEGFELFSEESLPDEPSAS